MLLTCCILKQNALSTVQVKLAICRCWGYIPVIHVQSIRGRPGYFFLGVSRFCERKAFINPRKLSGFCQSLQEKGVWAQKVGGVGWGRGSRWRRAATTPSLTPVGLHCIFGVFYSPKKIVCIFKNGCMPHDKPLCDVAYELLAHS